MRPSAGGDALPSARQCSRKSSVADQSTAHSGPSSHVPTAFFLRSEEEMEQSLSSSQGTEIGSRQRDSSYGVQSLADTLEAAFGEKSSATDKTIDMSSATPENGNMSPVSPAQSPAKAPSRQTESAKSSPSWRHKRKMSMPSPSAPLTPLDIDVPSPLPASALPSTPKSASVHSLKLSDEESGLEDVASQVITSSGEEEDEEAQTGVSSSFPQLVMPSIQMPSRRPFTTKGKAMGKLKVLIAGEAGVGKTSLIRSIVQLCEEIVHVDPLSSPSSSAQSPPPPKSKNWKWKIESLGTSKITEVHASTKAYPSWWTDLEESRVRRRKSASDAVLERNLCFVDTPGFGKAVQTTDEQNMVIEYVESLLCKNASVTSMEDSDLLSVISGTGGVQVDVVFYLLSPKHDISKDVEFMQRLSALSNVIPIIAKSDTISATEVVAVKTSILARLQTTSIKPFFFGKPVEDALLAVQGLPIVASATKHTVDSAALSEPTQYPFNVPTYPYAISSTPGPDTETMDASLLMSPDYIQPLLPSELAALINQVFDPESIAWLRHSAAKKFLAWRHRAKLPGDSFIMHRHSLKRGSISSSAVGLNGAALNASSTSSVFSAASPSGVLVPRSTSPFYLSNSNYNSNLQSPFQASSPSHSHSPNPDADVADFSLARYNNYAQGEQRLAEVRLAKWATDLQRSLRNERDRFEDLQRAERTKWLLERVGEEVRDGTITTSPARAGTNNSCSSPPRTDWAVVRHGSNSGSSSSISSKKEILGSSTYARVGTSRDPLGLCDFSDEVRKRGFVLVQVLGGMSVLGAVVVAVIKTFGVEGALPENGLWGWLTGRGE
ncbi:hypothetical protein K491DRAFT_712836 [Lophiostoma macrostomum CBS 122681]|uniref:Septin-type G domain-containing protein n=1 Tax=Lophiostoma macrostomum CBS 122681 TaxID=1314788 RepID=A0A6A6TK47_9PLEO|nr:hypothetical protein K491DRAFT_712836 [Lophiostoma macrostomum CBS 122681]